MPFKSLSKEISVDLYSDYDSISYERSRSKSKSNSKSSTASLELQSSEESKYKSKSKSSTASLELQSSEELNYISKSKSRTASLELESSEELNYKSKSKSSTASLELESPKELNYISKSKSSTASLELESSKEWLPSLNTDSPEASPKHNIIINMNHQTDSPEASPKHNMIINMNHVEKSSPPPSKKMSSSGSSCSKKNMKRPIVIREPIKYDWNENNTKTFEAILICTKSLINRDPNYHYYELWESLIDNDNLESPFSRPPDCGTVTTSLWEELVIKYGSLQDRIWDYFATPQDSSRNRKRCKKAKQIVDNHGKLVEIRNERRDKIDHFVSNSIIHGFIKLNKACCSSCGDPRIQYHEPPYDTLPSNLPKDIPDL